MFKNALVSVANKDGLIEFLKPLAQRGMRIVSTGGTAKWLQEHGIEVVKISEQTGFPEVMEGRVKTLHPRIHMALLARNYKAEDISTLNKYELAPFDLVVGNLYAFEKAMQEGLGDRELQEFIDIGGPSFLRAAAKNFSQITTICDPADYQWIATKENLDEEDRKALAAKVFYHVSAYDAMVAKALKSTLSNKLTIDKYFSVGGDLVQTLRYGENPQQKGSWYRIYGEPGLHQTEILQGKELSYNNLLDLDAAINTVNSFTEPACVAVKHNNPCGVGIGAQWDEALNKALSADPVSVFGGIIAFNGIVNDQMAKQLSAIFLECIVAIDFTYGALNVFKAKKNLRLLKAGTLVDWPPAPEVRKIRGGFLVQEADVLESSFSPQWEIVGRSPNEEIKKEMIFAMKVCAHLKSNAIAITCQGQSLGLGMGQVNRVDAVQQAIARVRQFHPHAKSMVLASDAFFPFADSIELAAAAGIQWIVQPGGSLRDGEVITAVKKYDMGMILTGQRHFRH